jgi:hypothetical protein
MRPSFTFGIEMTHGAGWGIDNLSSPKSVKFSVRGSVHLISWVFDLAHLNTIIGTSAPGLFWLYPIFGQNQGLHKTGIEFTDFLCKAP